MRTYRIVAAFGLMFFLASMSVVPEETKGATGAVTITVSDANGNPLPGATVLISHPLNYVNATASMTNADGIVTFLIVRVGEGYVIEVSFPGYATFREENIRITGGQMATVPVRLVREYQEGVRVTAERDVVSLEETGAMPQFSDDFISDLPVPGRFYQNVLSLSPGVQDADGDGNPNTHGTQNRDFQAQVSGISNVDPLTGAWMSRINPNSVEEMEVITAGAGVEFGRAQGGFASMAVSAEAAPKVRELLNTAKYKAILDNAFLLVQGNPPLTFGAERDTASWANVRRFINDDDLPPLDAVDVTEMINYFPYDYPPPAGSEPFSVSVEVAEAPWAPEHQLVRFGFRTREVSREQTAGSSITFLIDVSGSMDGSSNYEDLSKIKLVQIALRLVAAQLTSTDTVSIVVYAGREAVVLEPTSGSNQAAIMQVIDDLSAGGTTNGEAGLRKAYEMARANFVEGGVNQVVLITDGDFNIGETNEGDIVPIAKEYADRGIFLMLLGVGGNNFNSELLSGLTRANGTYHSIDSPFEAQKILVDELGGNLMVVARDVKFLVDFNPHRVAAYRLIGYEHRVMSEEEFYDDTKTEKAGEIGSDHMVTALVEIVPVTSIDELPKKDRRRYQKSITTTEAASDELCQLKVRYKQPSDGPNEKAIETQLVISQPTVAFSAASNDFRFATSIAAFAMLLRGSEHLKGSDGKALVDFSDVQKWAAEARGSDTGGYRTEAVALIERAARARVAELAAARD